MTGGSPGTVTGGTGGNMCEGFGATDVGVVTWDVPVTDVRDRSVAARP